MQMGGVAVARERFSWGKGLLHGVIPVLVLLAAGSIAMLAGWFPTAKATVQAVTLAGALVFAGALAASWLLQTGRRGCGLAGFIAVALLTLAATAGVLAFPLLLRLHPTALTAEDKRFPEIYWDLDGQRFRHSTLGFSLPAPTERFAEAPVLAEQMRTGLAGISAWAWAWEDGSTGERILITLGKGQAAEQKDFEEYCEGMKQALAAQDGMSVVRDEVRWKDGRGDYLLQALIQGRVHFDTRCISGRAGERSSYVACAMTVAGEPTWSRRFLAGLEAEEPAG
jgi:hypothetical protein